jgi:hypothetical protein
VRSFFPADPAPLKETPQRAITRRDASIHERSLKLLKRHVRCLIEKRQDQRRVGFDPAGAPVAAQCFGTRIANRALK